MGHAKLLFGLVAWVIGVSALNYTAHNVSSVNASITVPILANKHALHPRNKNVQGDALVDWMDRERNHLQSKYGRRNISQSPIQARQMAGLTDVGADGFYYLQVGIGTPQKKFNVILDTGSADVWLADVECGGCNGMDRYDASKSSSYHGSNKPFTVPYGIGSVGGTLAADDVTMADYKIKDLTFGRATKLVNNAIRAPAAGLMGMAFSKLSSTSAATFWQVVAASGKFIDPVFSFQLVSNVGNVRSASDTNPGGIFTLGKLDDSQYSGDITWVNTASQFGSRGSGYWAIPMEKIQVNGHTVSLGSNNIAAVDTGTTLIGGPAALVKAIYANIPNAKPAPENVLGGRGYYVFPCKQSFKLELTLGGKAFTLDSATLNIGAISTKGDQCASALFIADNDASAGMPGWILGDAFLRTVYTVFSWSPERIGFAALPEGGAKASPDAAGTPIASTSNAPANQASLPVVNGLPTPSVASAPNAEAAPSSSAQIIQSTSTSTPETSSPSSTSTQPSSSSAASASSESSASESSRLAGFSFNDAPVQAPHAPRTFLFSILLMPFVFFLV